MERGRKDGEGAGKERERKGEREREREGERGREKRGREGGREGEKLPALQQEHAKEGGWRFWHHLTAPRPS